MARSGTPRTGSLASQVEELRSRLAQAQRAQREVDHRAANNLQILAAFLKLQRKGAASPEAQEALAIAAARVAALARAHRHFQARADPGDVDLALLLADLAADLSISLGLRCRVEVEPVLVPAATATHMVIMVNELVVNAHKHAFRDPAQDGGEAPGEGPGEGTGGEVAITGRLTEEGHLRVAVADEGRGLPEGFKLEATTGLGMQVVRGTAQQLGGEVAAWTDGGAHFVVTIPLARPLEAPGDGP